MCTMLLRQLTFGGRVIGWFSMEKFLLFLIKLYGTLLLYWYRWRLRSKNSKTRYNALRSLGYSGEIPGNDVPPFLIIKYLSDENIEVRSQAIRSLSWLYHSDAITYLITYLKNADEQKREQLITGLAETNIFDERLLEHVLLFRSHQKPEIRSAALKILSRGERNRARSFVIEGLQDEHFSVKKTTITILADIGFEEEIPVLEKFIYDLSINDINRKSELIELARTTITSIQNKIW
jgi:hypothetical protein